MTKATPKPCNPLLNKHLRPFRESLLNVTKKCKNATDPAKIEKSSISKSSIRSDLAENGSFHEHAGPSTSAIPPINLYLYYYSQESRPSVRHISFLIMILSTLISGSGCAHLSPYAITPQVSPGPLMVMTPNQEMIWEQTTEVLHAFLFDIERENKLTHEIETEYKVGSGVFEPWHRESVGPQNRWESTLQSIRRKVIVRIVPTDDLTGHYVTVEAFKELEVPNGLAANSPGGATFQENAPLKRDLNLVVGQTQPSNWQALGRDSALEQAILAELRVSLGG